ATGRQDRGHAVLVQVLPAGQGRCVPARRVLPGAGNGEVAAALGRGGERVVQLDGRDRPRRAGGHSTGRGRLTLARRGAELECPRPTPHPEWMDSLIIPLPGLDSTPG